MVRPWVLVVLSLMLATLLIATTNAQNYIEPAPSPLVEKGSKPAGTIYFYRRIRLSTDYVMFSGGSLKKLPLEIVFLLAVP
jgi:hypothetical protein